MHSKYGLVNEHNSHVAVLLFLQCISILLWFLLLKIALLSISYFISQYKLNIQLFCVRTFDSIKLDIPQRLRVPSPDFHVKCIYFLHFFNVIFWFSQLSSWIKCGMDLAPGICVKYTPILGDNRQHIGTDSLLYGIRLIIPPGSLYKTHMEYTDPVPGTASSWLAL